MLVRAKDVATPDSHSSKLHSSSKQLDILAEDNISEPSSPENNKNKNNEGVNVMRWN